MEINEIPTLRENELESKSNKYKKEKEKAMIGFKAKNLDRSYMDKYDSSNRTIKRMNDEINCLNKKYDTQDYRLDSYYDYKSHIENSKNESFCIINNENYDNSIEKIEKRLFFDYGQNFGRAKFEKEKKNEFVNENNDYNQRVYSNKYNDKQIITKDYITQKLNLHNGMKNHDEENIKIQKSKSEIDENKKTNSNKDSEIQSLERKNKPKKEKRNEKTEKNTSKDKRKNMENIQIQTQIDENKKLKTKLKSINLNYIKLLKELKDKEKQVNKLSKENSDLKIMINKINGIIIKK